MWLLLVCLLWQPLRIRELRISWGLLRKCLLIEGIYVKFLVIASRVLYPSFFWVIIVRYAKPTKLFQNQIRADKSRCHGPPLAPEKSRGVWDSCRDRLRRTGRGRCGKEEREARPMCKPQGVSMGESHDDRGLLTLVHKTVTSGDKTLQIQLKPKRNVGRKCNSYLNRS